MMKSHEDKKSVNVSPISISRADMESLFYSKFNLWTKCFNEANNESDHSIIIICYAERKVLTKEKQCIVVKMNKTVSYDF